MQHCRPADPPLLHRMAGAGLTHNHLWLGICGWTWSGGQSAPGLDFDSSAEFTVINVDLVRRRD